nr:uncharacterized protein yisb [Quercus suber]
MILSSESPNFEIFRDSLSTLVLERLAPSSSSARGKNGATRKRGIKGRKNEIKPVVRSDEDQEEDGAELSEFVEYLAEEIFLSLPSDLRSLTYAQIQDDAHLAEKYSVPMDSALVQELVENLPVSTHDSLTTYDLIPPSSSQERFLEQVVSTYIATASAAPPEHMPSVLATGCEICEREHLPLTYHHLIPRQMHVKAVKRGWAKEWELDKVAWLCRACHSFVHKIASNEELAKELNSVETLMEREDVLKWAAWVGKGEGWSHESIGLVEGSRNDQDGPGLSKIVHQLDVARISSNFGKARLDDTT